MRSDLYLLPPSLGSKVLKKNALGSYFQAIRVMGGTKGNVFCDTLLSSDGASGWRVTCSLLFLLVLLGLQLLTACAPPRSSRVTIGAKNFTERVVLGELLAQEIEAVTGQPVARRFYLAGSYICQQALVSGRIDGYVEYTGTALTAILKQPLPPVGQHNFARANSTRRRTDVVLGPNKYGFYRINVGY